MKKSKVALATGKVAQTLLDSLPTLGHMMSNGIGNSRPKVIDKTTKADDRASKSQIEAWNREVTLRKRIKKRLAQKGL